MFSWTTVLYFTYTSCIPGLWSIKYNTVSINQEKSREIKINQEMNSPDSECSEEWSDSTEENYTSETEEVLDDLAKAIGRDIRSELQLNGQINGLMHGVPKHANVYYYLRKYGRGVPLWFFRKYTDIGTEEKIRIEYFHGY
jgi:hypothetical protein